MKIMLCGRKGSGKDEAALFLSKQYGGKIFRFSQPLYDMMYSNQEILGIDKFKDRKFLTAMGDHYKEVTGNVNVFVDFCFTSANKLSGENIYIVDGRYDFELDAGKKNNYYLVEVSATDTVRQERRPGENINDSHTSENGYPSNYQFDFKVDNSGSLENLYNQLESIVNTIIMRGDDVIY